VEAAHAVAARTAVHGTGKRVLFINALRITAGPLAFRRDAQVDTLSFLAGLLQGAVVAVIARSAFVVIRVHAFAFLAEVEGTDGAVVAFHRLPIHAPLLRVAGFQTVAEVSVVAQCVVRFVQDDIHVLVARISRAVESIVHSGRHSNHASLFEVAKLRAVAEEAIVAHAMVGHVFAFVVLEACIFGAVEAVVAEGRAVNDALTFLARAGLLALAFVRCAGGVDSLVFILAARIFGARVDRAGIGVITFHNGPGALQRSRDVVIVDAVVILGAQVTVIAADAGFLPFFHAGIGVFFCLVVAPGCLARMLGDTFMGRSSDTLAGCAAAIAIGAGIAVEAWVALGMELHAVTHTVGGVADKVHAVVRVGIVAQDRLPALAYPGLAGIPRRA